MILFIDNYDSFTYNLVQFCGSVNPDIKVVRNDEITVDEIKKLAPSHIILSPGPGYPKDAGICEEVIKELAGQFPILGICLGHQAICEVYGATIAHAIKLMHGKKSDIIVDTDKKIFNGLPKVVEGARYHSLIAKRETVPDTLEVIAEDRDGEVMREKALHIKPNRDVLDIVGTGGDGTGTFNISTTAAFIIAAAGIPVAKHGNRSMSSKSGSADCLEQLGININITPEKSEEVLNKAGICFMFAQGYHSSMKYVGPVRKEIGIRNIFNVLGPLTNPAGADLQVTGVYSEALVEPIAQVFSNLGVKKGYVFYGMDGMDEVTLTTTTKVCEIDNGKFNTFILNPEDYGLKLCAPEDLAGGDGKENAEITKEILSGEIKDAKRDIVVLNAALGLCTGGKADSIQDGIKLANEIIDSGKAYAKIEEFAKASNE